jgi:hypothetical protein
LFKKNTYRSSFAFILVLGASIAAQAQIRQTISVQELYNEYNAKPVAGTISVQQLMAESTPAAGTISVKQLLAESTPVAGTISVRALQAEHNATELPVNVSTSLPRMAPELALDTYFQRSQRQTMQLGAYTAKTVIEADLPSTAQHGEFELMRSFSAPNSLKFQPVRFEGDGFVKSNVIVRMLQSETSHVEKNLAQTTALTDSNYKFTFKGDDQIGGRVVHVYAVKPREKRVGLFKGHVSIDVTTGSLVRAQGEFVKSPSVFIKKIEFVQDFTDVGGFTLPVHMHSVADTRVYGKAIVEVDNRGYQPRPVDAMAARETAATLGN